MMHDESYPLLESRTKSGKRRKWAVALIAAVVIGLVIIPMTSSVTVWCGGVHCPITVAVLDHQSDTPVESAEIEILGRFELRIRESLGGKGSSTWEEAMKNSHVVGHTDGRGIVLLGADFGAGGRKGVLGGKNGSYSVAHILEVSHPDYEPVRVTLASLLGKDRFPLSKKELAVKVWLIPKTSACSPPPGDRSAP